MARRRFQKGQLFKSGKRRKVWVGRWREDVLLENGEVADCRGLDGGKQLDIGQRQLFFAARPSRRNSVKLVTDQTSAATP